MSAESRSVTIMIIRDVDSATKSIKLSSLAYRFFLLLLLVFALVFVVETVTYVRLVSHSRQRNELLAENDELKRYNAKVVQLEKDLATNRMMLRKMTELAGIDLGEFGLDDYSAGHGVVTEPMPEHNWSLPQTDGRPHLVPLGAPIRGWVSRTYRPESDNPRLRHLGIDFAIGIGNPVLATADGKVSFAGWDKIFGWKVIVDHAESWQTIYGHNDSLLVQVDDDVTFGQTIALSGNTGVSSAPHLHYEIRKDGEPINPEGHLTIGQ